MDLHPPAAKGMGRQGKGDGRLPPRRARRPGKRGQHPGHQPFGSWTSWCRCSSCPNGLTICAIRRSAITWARELMGVNKPLLTPSIVDAVVKKVGRQQITNSKDLRKLRVILRDPVARAHFVEDDATIDSADAARRRRRPSRADGLISQLDATMKTIRDVPWTELEEAQRRSASGQAGGRSRRTATKPATESQFLVASAVYERGYPKTCPSNHPLDRAVTIHERRPPLSLAGAEAVNAGISTSTERLSVMPSSHNPANDSPDPRTPASSPQPEPPRRSVLLHLHRPRRSVEAFEVFDDDARIRDIITVADDLDLPRRR